MSKTFLIENTRPTEVITPDQLMKMIPELVFYRSESDKDKLEEMLHSPLPEPEAYYRFAIPRQSVRGVTVGYVKEIDHYHLRINTPAPTGDWEVAFRIVQTLAKSSGGKIAFGDGTPNEKGQMEFYTGFTVEKLPEEIPWRQGIQEGLQMAVGSISDEQLFMIQGLYRTMHFNRQMLQACLDAQDSVKAFSDLCNQVQYPAGTLSSKSVYRVSDGRWFGLQAIVENTPTVLPRGRPELPDQYKEMGVKEEEVRWHVFFWRPDKDNNPNYMAPYLPFIQELRDESNWTPVDATESLLRGISEAEFWALKSKLPPVEY